jgi:hypothetical protein
MVRDYDDEKFGYQMLVQNDKIIAEERILAHLNEADKAFAHLAAPGAIEISVEYLPQWQAMTNRRGATAMTHVIAAFIVSVSTSTYLEEV